MILLRSARDRREQQAWNRRPWMAADDHSTSIEPDLSESGSSGEALARKTRELAEANRRLTESEARYKAALSAGLLGAWETDLVKRRRRWTEEGMALFGLSLPGGEGRIGGPDDEYLAALHPDDRHLMVEFHETAQTQDSFTSEYRVVWPDGTVHWLRGHGQVVERGPDGEALRLISIVADVTERKAAEDHVAFLMHELAHRSKNLLTVVQSVARRTAGASATVKEFLKDFEARLVGLAASHDVLLRTNWRGAPLAELLCRHLNPFVDTQSARLVLDGPEVLVSAEAAQALGLAVHELATNAAKYGALSVPGGRLNVAWRITRSDGAPCLRLDWTERDGPAIEPPSQQGFGQVVIGEIARSLDGKVEMAFAPNGLSLSIAIPATHFSIAPTKGAE